MTKFYMDSGDCKTLAKLGQKIDPNAADGLAKMLSTSSTINPQMQQIAEVIARKRSQEQVELTEAAAELIIKVIGAGDQAIEELRAENAMARRTAEAAVNKIEKIAVARAYGEQTMNFVPLMILLGQEVRLMPDLVTEVPEAEAKKILAEIKAARTAAKKAASK